LERFSEFNQANLIPGEKKCYVLELFETVGRQLTVEVLAVKGHRPGSVLLAAAGVHGDEYEGIFAVRRLFEELKPEEMSGTFLGIPVCNTLAFENLSRETPVYADGLNLAREFPGNPSGSYTQRLADALMSFALRNLRSGADALIDLHSSGTRYEYLPMMGAHLTACFEREKELCRATGFSNLWELNKNPKSLNGAASAAGVVSLGAEVAGRGGARVGDIRIYADALRGLCGYMGIAPYPYTIREGAFLPAHTQKFEHSGLFLSSRELGCMLHQGDQIGVLYDPQCEAMETLTAACDGVLWGIRRHVAVYAGEVAYILAKKNAEEGLT